MFDFDMLGGMLKTFVARKNVVFEITPPKGEIVITYDENGNRQVIRKSFQELVDLFNKDLKGDEGE